MPRCLIHIGHAKTATTFLQQCMHLNADLLLAHDLRVPSDFTALGFYDLKSLAAAGDAISGNLAPMHELLTKGPGVRVPAMMAALFDPPAGQDGADLLLSSELFFYYPEQLGIVVAAARARGYTPELLVYLQHQSQGIIANYLQYVRAHGYSFGVIDFLLHDSFMQYAHYASRLDAICAAAPETSINVRSFDAGFLFQNDVLADFLFQIGCNLPAAHLQRPARSANTGLLLEQYELIKAASIVGDTDAVKRLQSIPAELTPAMRARVHAYYYQPYVQEFVADHYVAENSQLTRNYMPRATRAERRFWETCAPATPPPPLDTDILQTLTRIAGL